jgi:hypothetical protein
MGFLVSVRIIQGIIAAITTAWPSLAPHVSIKCAELRYIYLSDKEPGSNVVPHSDFDQFASLHPQCLKPGSENTYVVVEGLLLGKEKGRHITSAASLRTVMLGTDSQRKPVGSITKLQGHTLVS